MLLNMPTSAGMTKCAHDKLPLGSARHTLHVLGSQNSRALSAKHSLKSLLLDDDCDSVQITCRRRSGPERCKQCLQLTGYAILVHVDARLSSAMSSEKKSRRMSSCAWTLCAGGCGMSSMAHNKFLWIFSFNTRKQSDCRDRTPKRLCPLYRDVASTC